MFRTILSLFLLAGLLLSPASLEAKRRHKRHDRDRHQSIIVIEDHTGDTWRSFIPETVEDFRALGLEVRYESGEEIACGQLPPNRDPKHRIVLCETASAEYGAQAFIGAGRIQFTTRASSSRGWQENVVCHEFMHMLAEVPDNYDSDPNSCVWGRLLDPGPTDVALLAKHHL